MLINIDLKIEIILNNDAIDHINDPHINAKRKHPHFGMLGCLKSTNNRNPLTIAKMNHAAIDSTK
jgi:hypothetical protein